MFISVLCLSPWQPLPLIAHQPSGQRHISRDVTWTHHISSGEILQNVLQFFNFTLQNYNVRIITGIFSKSVLAVICFSEIYRFMLKGNWGNCKVKSCGRRKWGKSFGDAVQRVSLWREESEADDNQTWGHLKGGKYLTLTPMTLTQSQLLSLSRLLSASQFPFPAFLIWALQSRDFWVWGAESGRNVVCFLERVTHTDWRVDKVSLHVLRRRVRRADDILWPWLRALSWEQGKGAKCWSGRDRGTRAKLCGCC